MKQLKQLQAQFTSNALLTDTDTLSTLITFCSLSTSGDRNYARQLFDRASSPNRFMYNTLIRGYSDSNTKMESFVLLRQMMAQGFSPNNFTFPFVLKAVGEYQAFEMLVMIHSMIVKTGFASQVVVMNALLHAYVVCGHVWFARKVFDAIPEKSIVSWNSMIDAYCQMGDCSGAIELFGVMRGLGLEPDEFTLASLLSACAQSRDLERGRVLHHFVVMNCVEDDLIVNNALIDMYGKCGEPVLARMCFDRMPARNVVSWTSLVRGYAQNGLLDLARSCFEQMRERSTVSWNAMIDCYVRSDRCHEALVLFEQMKISGVVPDEVTLISVLSACSQIGNFVVGKRTHDYIVQNITNPGLSLLNSVIDMYGKCGHLDVALNLFNMIENKNVVSWNVMIGALAIHGNSLEAIELFKSMTGGHGLFPDGITFVGVLSACSHGGLIELGRNYFEAMNVLYNVRHEIEHYACMVDLFGRGGYLGRAVKFIGRMPMKPDAVIWGALLGACRIHGDLRIGLLVMKQILELDAYSSGLFVLLSNLFCEVQRWENVMKVRKMMNWGGVKKVEGRSSIEIGGKVHEFLVEDLRHESSRNIYFLMDQLTDHLMSLAPFSNYLETFLFVEE